jgi:hypothetical protein
LTYLNFETKPATCSRQVFASLCVEVCVSKILASAGNLSVQDESKLETGNNSLHGFLSTARFHYWSRVQYWTINFLLHWRVHPYRDPIFFYYRLFLGSIPLLIFFLEISNDGVLYVFYAVSFNFGWKMKF